MKVLLRRLPWLLVVLALVGALVWGFWPEPIAVEVAEVTRGTLELTVEEDGVTRVREKYVVSTPVDGNLLRVEWNAGDEVVRDESVLARIAPGDPDLNDARAVAQAEARVRAAEASLEQARARLERTEHEAELAERELQRAQQLAERRTITREVVEHAEHTARMARADVRSATFGVTVAEFEIDLAEAALVWSRPNETKMGEHETLDDLLVILSPTSGRVLRILREDAGAITAGTSLVEIGDPRDLELVIDVLSTDAVRIAPGDLVTIRRWGGEADLQAVVRLVEPAAFLEVSALGVEEQRVNVIADFSDTWESRKSLGDAYRVEASIVVEERRDVLSVPTGAVFRDGDAWKVFCVVEGRAQPREVQPGVSSGLRTEIRSGLTDGDVVVVYPSDKIEDGVAVRPR